jgi:hypothetical protein
VLQRIAGQGGPAGEAAEMVLQGRREKGDSRRESGERGTVNGVSSALVDEVSD